MKKNFLLTIGFIIISLGIFAFFLVMKVSYDEMKSEAAFQEVLTLSNEGAEIPTYNNDEYVKDIMGNYIAYLDHEVLYCMEIPLKCGGRGAFPCTKEAYENANGKEKYLIPYNEPRTPGVVSFIKEDGDIIWHKDIIYD